MRPVFFKRRRQGLTLIELVLVVAVLAILAGFIVPRLGFIRNLAGNAGNATIVADATNQAVLYNTAEGHYPSGEDTLLSSGGTGLDASLNGGLRSALTVQALDASAALSLTAQITGSASGGTITLYNQADLNTASPNQDDSAPYAISASSTSDLAFVNGSTTLGAAVLQAAYGIAGLTNVTTNALTGVIASAGIADGTELVALGYGSNSQINGKTGLEAPVLFDKTQGQYTRPVLLLKLFGAGSTAAGVPVGTAATTSTTISFDGTTVNSNLASYAVNQNR